jgi:hypothetical protein
MPHVVAVQNTAPEYRPEGRHTGAGVIDYVGNSERAAGGYRRAFLTTICEEAQAMADAKSSTPFHHRPSVTRG